MAAELAAGGAVLAAAAGMIIWAEHSGVKGPARSQSDLHRFGSVLIGPAWEAWAAPAPPASAKGEAKAKKVVIREAPVETPTRIFNAPDSPPRLPVKPHLLFEEGDEPPGTVELLQQQVDEMAALVNEHAQMRAKLDRQLEAEMTLRREAEEKEGLARAELMRYKREAERELEKERQTVTEVQGHLAALAAANPGEPPPMVLRQKQAELDTEKRKTMRAEADVRRLRAEMEAAADQHAKEVAALHTQLEEAQRAAQRAASENMQLRRKLREQAGPAAIGLASAPSSPAPSTPIPSSSSSSSSYSAAAAAVHLSPAPPAVSPAVLWGGQS